MEHNNKTLDAVCDWGMVAGICASIFVLPAAIAYLDSFAAVAIFCYMVKKISRIVLNWHQTAGKKMGAKLCFIWNGFAPPPNMLNKALQILVLAVLLSVILSQFPKLSILAFFGKFIKCVFLYFSFLEAFNNERRIWIFLNCFFFSAFVVSLSGVAEHFWGRDFIKGHTVGLENGLPTRRINSSFFDANGFGTYLLPVIGLMTHIVFTTIIRRQWLMGAVAACFLALLLYCLCWTFSRSSWVGYLTILLVMTVIDRRKILFAVGLVLIFVGAFLPFLNNVRHMSLINDEVKQQAQETHGTKSSDEYGSGRSGYWKTALQVIHQSPIWGTGLNTYARVLKRDTDKDHWFYAHNSYLQIAAETGIIGLLSFLALLFVILSGGLNYCKHIHDIWPLTLLQGTLASLGGFWVQSFFDNTFFSVQLCMLMWMMFGLLVAVTRLAPQPVRN